MARNRSSGKKGKKPLILKVNPDNPQQRLINRVKDVLESGGIIVYPTDTFYGIGCDLFNKKAIQQIYKLKNRPLNKPFSFVCDSLKEISRYAIVSNYAYKTMKRLLPGPYTFVLEGTNLVPKIMLTNRKTVGIRVPDNKICLSIVRTLGHPIISTSAGYKDPVSIEKAYGPFLDAIIDDGVLYQGPPEEATGIASDSASSVISLIDDIPEVIREGKGDISSFL